MVAILPSLRVTIIFWRLTSVTASTAATLLPIWLFKLKLGSDWLFCGSFGSVRSLSLPDWYSVSDWEYTGIGSHSSSSLLSCSLSWSIIMTSGISLIKGLSEPNVSLR